MSESHDKSVDELSKSFHTKASLKRSPTFSSKEFEQNSGKIADLASLIEQQVTASQESTVVRSATGKRIRHSSIDESKTDEKRKAETTIATEDSGESKKWQEQVSKRSRIR